MSLNYIEGDDFNEEEELEEMPAYKRYMLSKDPHIKFQTKEEEEEEEEEEQELIDSMVFDEKGRPFHDRDGVSIDYENDVLDKEWQDKFN